MNANFDYDNELEEAKHYKVMNIINVDWLDTIHNRKIEIVLGKGGLTLWVEDIKELMRIHKSVFSHTS